MTKTLATTFIVLFYQYFSPFVFHTPIKTWILHRLICHAHWKVSSTYYLSLFTLIGMQIQILNFHCSYFIEVLDTISTDFLFETKISKASTKIENAEENIFLYHPMKNVGEMVQSLPRLRVCATRDGATKYVYNLNKNDNTYTYMYK